MKRKNSETTQVQNLARLLQEIKSILPERFVSRKITELEQSEGGLESATTEDIKTVKNNLETFIPLLALRYCKAELKAHQSKITLKIEEIDTILRSVELPQNIKQKLAKDRAEEEDEIEDSDLEEEDEIEDSDDEVARDFDAENTPPSNVSSQNSADPSSSYPEGTPHDHYDIIQAHQEEIDLVGSLPST